MHASTSNAPQCSECGRFMKYVDKTDEIQALHDEAVANGTDPVDNGVPPGPWGYHTCENCDGDTDG